MKEEKNEQTKPKLTKKELLIKYKSTFYALHKFIEAHNEPFERGNDPRRLKGTTKMVAQSAIILYGEQLAKTGKSLVPADKCEGALDYMDDLKTNNGALAQRAGVSTRTVRTHINKLIAAGFFINKRHHGPVMNFDLRFNPKVLRVKQFEDAELIEKDIKEILEAAREQAGIKAFKKRERKNSPPINTTRDLNKNYNNPVDGVEKVSPLRSDDHEQDTTSNNNKDRGEVNEKKITKQAESKETATNQTVPSSEVEKKQGQEAGAAAPNDDIDEKFKPKAPTKVKKLIAEAALKLWLLAYQHIFTGFEFGEKEKEKFRTFLQPYFYKCKTPEDVEVAMEQYSWRIEKAGKYFDQHPGFDKLHPFKYFDPDYKNGFIATKAWWKNYNVLRTRKIRVSSIAKMAVELKENPNLNTFQAYQKNVKSWGDPGLLNYFLKICKNINF